VGAVLIAACHSREAGWTNVEDLDRLSDLREEAGNLLWAETDVAALSQDEVELIAKEFDLPPLAVEDAVHTRQRPKLEPYEKQLFIVLHQLDEVNGQLESVQIAGFVGERFFLTLHAGADRTLSEAKRRWEQDQSLAEGPWTLLHTLLDVVVDDYQDIADRLEQEVENLEEIVLEAPDAPIQRQLYSVKQQLSRLRRYVLPSSRILEAAQDPDNPYRTFSDETAQLFRDVEDHLLRIADQVRNMDDLTQAVIDLARAEQAVTLTETSRKLSAWAAIFAVGTLIAGVYGMNFSLVPATNSSFGFWFSLGLMAASSLGLYFFFRKKRWL
jgi:magnesium transporter